MEELLLGSNREGSVIVFDIVRLECSAKCWFANPRLGKEEGRLGK